MTEQKLVVMVMGQDVDKYLEMCFESCKGADYIWYIDGGSTDKSLEIAKKYCKDSVGNSTIIQSKWDNNVIGMNGIQRNIYLNRLIQAYNDGMTWCICLDADELLNDDGIRNLKRFIQTAVPGMYSIKMEHLIGDICHVDATKDEHYVLHRLFKIKNNLSYPETAHPVLQNTGPREDIYIGGLYNNVTIWHLGYILPNSNMFLQRYLDNKEKSQMHTKEFLDKWYSEHMMGTYSKKEISLDKLPKVFLEHFRFNKDQIYYKNRLVINSNHFIDVYDWKEFFELNKKKHKKDNEKDMIIIGDGVGVRTYAAITYNLNVIGTDINEYAVSCANPLIKDYYIQDDIVNTKLNYTARLVACYDVLEHIDEDDINKAIENIKKLSTKYILISVPVIGDPNLGNDVTHKIKKNKEWWIEKFTEGGLKQITTPPKFLFNKQVYIFTK